MIWLISYPRSGNTFFRNILNLVYNIPSRSYKKDENRSSTEIGEYEVMKSHRLPEHIPLASEDKVIYLVRDGRDCCVSSAYRRLALNKSKFDYLNHLHRIILNKEQSEFGGWSTNVDAWIDRADLLIKFENLIIEPLKEMEKLRGFMNLPNPRVDLLPTFESQQTGNAPYLGNKEESNFFRRGAVGDWKREMPLAYKYLFNRCHGEALKKCGYTTASFTVSKNLKNEILSIMRMIRE